MSLSVLRDRLYQALGQAPPGIPVPACPWQKVNILPQAPRQQESIYQPGLGQPRAFQAQANSTFNTVTTGSTNYPNQYNNQYANMNGAPAPVSTYSAVNPVMSQPSAVPNKGPLAHKYPQYPQTTLASYETTNLYQPQPVQPDYSQGQNYYGGPVSTSYMTPLSQPSGSPTGLYPSNTPGGPSNQPPIPSFMDHKPKGAWNDPPMVKQKENKPKVRCLESIMQSHTHYCQNNR